MKKIDDTPVPEDESEVDLETVLRVSVALCALLDDLEKRIANLETQRTPQDENDDPEWY